MTQTKQINYTGPFITMVFLFFIVGFLTVVNQQFQKPLQAILLSGEALESIKNTLAVMITFSWFLSYPIFGGVGTNFVNKYGYKGALIRGLMIMVVGLAIFEGSVLYEEFAGGNIGEIPVSYFIFLLGSFIVGGGVTIMQVVINPYLVACKVGSTSDVQRQNIGGSANSIGTTLAPHFVGAIIFGGLATEQIQINQLIWPFVGLMVVIALVTFIVNKLHLPHIEGTTNEGGGKLERSIWSFRHLVLGVVAIFVYVGVEVCVGANIVMSAESFGSQFVETAATMAMLYWGGMLVGRLIGAAISKVSAKAQLTITSIAAGLLVAGAMATSNPWLLVGVGLFHSVMWPATFSLAVKGLGKYTSAGSGALMIGVLGGGVLPLFQGGMADWFGGDWTWTWTIVIVGEVYLLYYALLGSKIRKQDLIAE